jgi:hypothetical protein
LPFLHTTFIKRLSFLSRIPLCVGDELLDVLCVTIGNVSSLTQCSLALGGLQMYLVSSTLLGHFHFAVFGNGKSLGACLVCTDFCHFSFFTYIIYGKTVLMSFLREFGRFHEIFRDLKSFNAFLLGKIADKLG